VKVVVESGKLTITEMTAKDDDDSDQNEWDNVK
jgi:hypothetical protein